MFVNSNVRNAYIWVLAQIIKNDRDKQSRNI